MSKEKGRTLKLLRPLKMGRGTALDGGGEGKKEIEKLAQCPPAENDERRSTKKVGISQKEKGSRYQLLSGSRGERRGADFNSTRSPADERSWGGNPTLIP